MIFASRTPESLNSDPRRIVVLDHNGKIMVRFPTMKSANYYRSYYVPVSSARTAIDPRPEYTPTTTHPANPILVAFREETRHCSDSHPLSACARLALHFEEDGDFPDASHNEIQHANRVLTRLAAWQA